MSVDYAIEAVNSCKQLDITFLTDHTELHNITKCFLVIWAHKPSKDNYEEVGVGKLKFYCGRKYKVGFHMQATCNHKKCFIDISIVYRASTSGLMVCKVSDFR